jgi:hypothetical protein
MNNQMLDSNGSHMDPQPRNKTQIKESKLPENKEISGSLNASNVS